MVRSMEPKQEEVRERLPHSVWVSTSPFVHEVKVDLRGKSDSDGITVCGLYMQGMPNTHAKKNWRRVDGRRSIDCPACLEGREYRTYEEVFPREIAYP